MYVSANHNSVKNVFGQYVEILHFFMFNFMLCQCCAYAFDRFGHHSIQFKLQTKDITAVRLNYTQKHSKRSWEIMGSWEKIMFWATFFCPHKYVWNMF